MFRQHARQLDDRRCSGAIVVGTWRVLRRLKTCQRTKIGARADARVIVATHAHHSRRIATWQPRDHVDDIYYWSLRMPPHLHRFGVVLYAQTSPARPAVAAQLVEQVSPRGADPARGA